MLTDLHQSGSAQPLKLPPIKTLIHYLDNRHSQRHYVPPSQSYGLHQYAGMDTHSGTSDMSNKRIRPRRRPDEMERLYACREKGCTKAYESISHLNTHIKRKGHGRPLTKSDFTAVKKLYNL